MLQAFMTSRMGGPATHGFWQCWLPEQHQWQLQLSLYQDGGGGSGSWLELRTERLGPPQPLPLPSRAPPTPKQFGTNNPQLISSFVSIIIVLKLGLPRWFINQPDGLGPKSTATPRRHRRLYWLCAQHYAYSHGGCFVIVVIMVTIALIAWHSWGALPIMCGMYFL